jgi:pyruvate/2-oxoglutarate dehydrogenase complex dihydrolipoamide dehydrogenase (E3) component
MLILLRSIKYIRFFLNIYNKKKRGNTWGLGGTCVNVGCIPKKLMHTAGLFKVFKFNKKKEIKYYIKKKKKGKTIKFSRLWI